MNHLQWIKSLKGDKIQHLNWKDMYDKIRATGNSSFPGYMIHEAVAWDPTERNWLFIPRKVSYQTPYSEAADELLGSNILFIASEDFKNITYQTVGPFEPDWGFSDLKVLPKAVQKRGTPTLLMAVKVKEVKGRTHTKVIIFDTNGTIHTDPQFQSISSDHHDESAHGFKFEGLAFVPPELQASRMIL